MTNFSPNLADVVHSKPSEIELGVLKWKQDREIQEPAIEIVSSMSECEFGWFWQNMGWANYI